MRRRTKAREVAVQFLYQLDLRGESALAELDTFLEDARQQGALLDEDGREFARRRVLGTWQHRAAIDEILARVARNWQIGRMATVDRNVIRLGIHELLHCPDVPAKVAINEAIEIGKRFSTQNTGAFVNGILDRVRIDHHRGADDGPARGRRSRHASDPAPALIHSSSTVASSTDPAPATHDVRQAVLRPQEDA